MIRNLTEEEIQKIRDTGCLFCNSQKFIEGPSGGLCINVMCGNEDCQAKYNSCGPAGIELLEEPKPIYGGLL